MLKLQFINISLVYKEKLLLKIFKQKKELLVNSFFKTNNMYLKLFIYNCF